MNPLGNDNITLDEWQKLVLPGLRKCELKEAPLENITLLAYFFWDDERIETRFYEIECSFLCAYHAFGLAPSVLVVNRATRTITDFCSRYHIDLQVEPDLTGGIEKMSLDCITTLYKRIKTDYAVIIQTDGIIVNRGLENFIGRWDYIGAPWAKDSNGPWWSHQYRYPVGNGGLSLRSRRICEAAAHSYNRFWKHLPYSWFVCDDVFYCKTMRFLGGRKWKRFSFPDIRTAAAFSIENYFADGTIPSTPPIGFHGEQGFENYKKAFGIPLSVYL